MMISEISTQHAERTHILESRPYAAIPGRTIIGPVIEVHIVQLLGSHGLEIPILSVSNPERLS